MLHQRVTASRILAGRLRLQPHASGYKPNQGRWKMKKRNKRRRRNPMNLVLSNKQPLAPDEMQNDPTVLQCKKHQQQVETRRLSGYW